MTWRVARSLERLLAEIDARSPQRSRKSDGAIGDAAHQSRDSDHNPWVRLDGVGIVTARDFTDDPGAGFDAGEFADWLRSRCKSGAEKRVKYIISERRICSTREDWAWRPYNGPNAHQHHVHVSVLSSRGRYDDDRSWAWKAGAPTKPPAIPQEDPDMQLDDKYKLTAADAAAYGRKADGKPYRAGDEVTIGYLLRHPPRAVLVDQRVEALQADVEQLQGLVAQLLKRTPARE